MLDHAEAYNMTRSQYESFQHEIYAYEFEECSLLDACSEMALEERSIDEWRERQNP